MARRVTAAAAAALLVSVSVCSSSSSDGSTATVTAAVTTTLTPKTTTSTEPANPDEVRWELVDDFRSHPSDNPFPRTADGPKVWSLRQGEALDRIGMYPLLPEHDRALRPGVSAWHGADQTCGGLPAIGVTASRPAPVCGAILPERAVFVSPSPSELAVVGWESPIAGDVVIGAGLADLDTRCGGAVPYWVDRGTTPLAWGEVVRGGSKTLPPLRAPVARGESIFFIVGPSAGAAAGCDAVQLQVTIAPAS